MPWSIVCLPSPALQTISSPVNEILNSVCKSQVPEGAKEGAKQNFFADNCGCVLQPVWVPQRLSQGLALIFPYTNVWFWVSRGGFGGAITGNALACSSLWQGRAVRTSSRQQTHTHKPLGNKRLGNEICR